MGIKMEKKKKKWPSKQFKYSQSSIVSLEMSENDEKHRKVKEELKLNLDNIDDFKSEIEPSSN